MTDSDKQLPASWGGIDLNQAAQMPHGAFAHGVRETKDPLFGWPDIPHVIADDLEKLKRDCPPAVIREPELIAHIRRHRENHPGLHRDGSDNGHHYDPCDPLAARNILEDFAERCHTEQLGLLLSETDWNNWTYPEEEEEADFDPNDFADEDDEEEDDDA